MSFLPNAAISPVPSKKREPTHGRAMAKAATPPPPTEDESDKAARAAIEAYKKQQMQALESDRRTLEALQSAIAKLGLQKQLNFMSGTTGSLDIQANGGDAPKMDFPPAAASTTVK
jgi:hypothetical protein